MIIADSTKLVPVLGKFPLPVEEIINLMARRRARGRDFSIVVVAEGAPVIVDNYLDTASASTALVVSLKDILLFGAQKDNFAIHGWEDVRLTAAKDATRAQIVGISLGWGPGEACYIPVGHVYLGVPLQLRLAPGVAHPHRSRPVARAWPAGTAARRRPGRGRGARRRGRSWAPC